MPDELKSQLKTEEDSPSLGGLASRYEIKQVVGKGGMGTVYRAMDLQLDREVAIKVISFEGSRDSKLQERFLKEARALVLLDHPNIVKLLSTGIDDNGNMYLVMEYVSGSALSQEIGNGKSLSPERFFKIFSQVLSGLRYAHIQGIVHRDLKPGNFIIGDEHGELHAKIIDFGIVRIEDEEAKPGQGLTKTGALLGSPRYMSPEQCKGEKAGRLSDIYAIGCVMYEAISGALPFDSESAVDLMYKHCMEVPASLTQKISGANLRKLGALIDQCLQKDPSKRPQQVEELQSELNAIFSQAGHSNSFFSERSKSRNRILGVSVVGVVVLLAAMSVPLLSNLNRQKSSSESSQEEDASKKQATRIEKINQLKHSIARKQHLLSINAVDEQSNETAWSAYRLSLELAKLQREAGAFDDGISSLQNIMPVCKYLQKNGSRQAETFLLKEIAVCQMDKTDYAAAEQTLEKALAMKATNFFKADVYEAYTQLQLTVHNLPKAKTAFQQLKSSVHEYEKKGDDPERRAQARFEAEIGKRHFLPLQQSSILRRVKGLAATVDKIQLNSDEERLATLDLLNLMLESCLPEQSSLKAKLVHQSEELLKGIAPNTPGYKEIAEKSQKLWKQVD